MTDTTKTASADRRRVYGLAALQFIIGIGAIGGGVVLVLDPSGSTMGISIEMLEASPFSDFLIPGLVLLVVNGLGSMVGGILTLKRYRYAGEVAIALGVFLVAWIVVQAFLLRGDIHPLHALYFFVGLAEITGGNRLRKLQGTAQP